MTYLPEILLFGIGGTLIMFLVMALCASALAKLFNLHISWLGCLLLSSVLSATDDVSTLSLIKMTEFPRLGSLLFGEGVLNDALSIALFQALHAEFRRGSNGVIDEDSWQSSGASAVSTAPAQASGAAAPANETQALSLASLAKQVLLQSVLSAAIGAMCGLLNARIFKVYPSLKSYPIHQTSLLLLFGYLSYAVAELCGVSGILTLFTTAVTLSHYSYHSMGRASRLASRVFLVSISDIAEGFSCMFLGISVWEFIEVNTTSDTFASSSGSGSSVVDEDAADTSVPFAMAMLLVLILGRMLTAISLFSFSSSVLGSQPLSKNEQLTFAFGGSVRGSIAFAQALQLQAWNIQSNNIIVSTAVLLCVVTSALSGFVLPWLMVLPESAEEHDMYPRGTLSTRRAAPEEEEEAEATTSPQLSSLAVKFSDAYTDVAVCGTSNNSNSSSCMRARITLEHSEDSDTEAGTVQAPRPSVTYGSAGHPAHLLANEESKANATSTQDTGTTGGSASGAPFSFSPSTKPTRSASVFSPARYYQNMDTVNDHDAAYSPTATINSQTTTYTPIVQHQRPVHATTRRYTSLYRMWVVLDECWLKPIFGGSGIVSDDGSGQLSRRRESALADVLGPGLNYRADYGEDDDEDGFDNVVGGSGGGYNIDAIPSQTYQRPLSFQSTSSRTSVATATTASTWRGLRNSQRTWAGEHLGYMSVPSAREFLAPSVPPSHTPTTTAAASDLNTNASAPTASVANANANISPMSMLSSEPFVSPRSDVGRARASAGKAPSTRGGWASRFFGYKSKSSGGARLASRTSASASASASTSEQVLVPTTQTLVHDDFNEVDEVDDGDNTDDAGDDDDFDVTGTLHPLETASAEAAEATATDLRHDLSDVMGSGRHHR